MAHDQLGHEREVREAFRHLRDLAGEPRNSYAGAPLLGNQALIEER